MEPLESFYLNRRDGVRYLEREATVENALICIPFLILYLIPLIKDASRPPYGRA